MLSLKHTLSIDLSEDREGKKQKCDVSMFEKLSDTIFDIIKYLELDDRRNFSITCKEALAYGPVIHKVDDPDDNKKLNATDDLVLVSFSQLELARRNTLIKNRIIGKYASAENVRIKGGNVTGRLISCDVFDLFLKVKLLEIIEAQEPVIFMDEIREVNRLRIRSKSSVFIGIENNVEEIGIYVAKGMGIQIDQLEKEGKELPKIKKLYGNSLAIFRTVSKACAVHSVRTVDLRNK